MQFKGLCCTSAFVYMLPLHLTVLNASLIAKWQTLRTYFTSAPACCNVTLLRKKYVLRLNGFLKGFFIAQ